MNLRELTELFQKLGANDAAGWARSQLREGIPQLARFLFLRQAWQNIVSEDDSSWIDASVESAQRDPDGPFAGAGHALTCLRGRGATDRELTDLVRAMQARLLFSLCYLLEDPGVVEPDVSEIAWGLFLLDENDEPTTNIGGLHESVLETDPTGREMRPRSQG